MKKKSKLPSESLLNEIENHRDQLYDSIARAFKARYIHDATQEHKFSIRRADIGEELAADMGVRGGRAFREVVHIVLLRMGIREANWGSHFLMKGVRRREHCQFRAEAETLVMKRGILKGETGRPANKSHWDKVMEDEGLPGELKGIGLVNPAVCRFNKNKFKKATEVFWNIDRDYWILRHYMVGCSIRDIAELTGMDRNAVWVRLKYYGLTIADDGDLQLNNPDHVIGQYDPQLKMKRVSLDEGDEPGDE